MHYHVCFDDGTDGGWVRAEHEFVAKKLVQVWAAQGQAFIAHYVECLVEDPCVGNDFALAQIGVKWCVTGDHAIKFGGYRSLRGGGYECSDCTASQLDKLLNQ